MATPDKKTQKYDRQLRLWGERGQSRLENSHICLLNGNALGTEILKNLVLPGIGQITVVDGNKVVAADLGSNFFVVESALGQSRAKTVAALLKELNEDLREVHVVEQDAAQWAEQSTHDSLAPYSLIVASELPPHALRTLAAAAEKRNIPLVAARVNGLVGLVRIQFPEHVVIETKPDFALEDLRLEQPFSELRQFTDAIDLSSLTSAQYAHVPFPALLIKARDLFAARHEGKTPSTRAEKEEFKKLITQEYVKDQITTNVEEAAKNAYLAYEPYAIPSDVQAILDDAKAVTITHDSSPFWVMAHALRKFVAAEGQGKYLPLKGSIPDMTAETKDYVRLQAVYHNQAEKDTQTMIGYVREACKSVSRDDSYCSEDDIRLFVKNAMFLKLIRYKSIAQELDAAGLNRDELEMQMMDSSSSAGWYVVFRGVDQFYLKHGRYPGNELSADLEKDFNELVSCVDEVIQHHGLSVSVSKSNDTALTEDMLREMVRFGGAHMHTIASILGGVVAQEMIKLLTQQWLPMDNTYVFNGIVAASAVLSV
jgi:amyloid beta precursor protein binding protein 1